MRRLLYPYVSKQITSRAIFSLSTAASTPLMPTLINLLPVYISTKPTKSSTNSLRRKQVVSMDTRESYSLRILMFPWLAHGHISPYLELAKKLSQRNFYIYFCSTPINLSSIKETLSEEAFPSIQLVELHLPSLPNLPPHYHTTKTLPPHLMTTLKKAFDMSQPSFSNILKDIKPDLLIYDFIQPWAPAAASRENIPAIHLFSTGAVVSCYILHMFKYPGSEFPFPSIYLHEHEYHMVVGLLDADDNKRRFLETFDLSSCIILVKTYREIEGKYIDYLSVLSGKEIVPVGPLVQEPICNVKQLKFIEWLDNKEKYSVVFVSFGSEYFMSRGEIQEIAYGLELSKVNFIWVVRFPEGETIRIDEVLPEGFIERVGQRGMVVEGWAPQAKILEHSSVGGFVSHCGWSSVMEGMKYGVPIIAMPMHLDQPLNARLVVELGVGMEVKINGRFTSEEVAKVITEVIVKKKGEEMRIRAKELMGNKEEQEIDEVAEKLMFLCGKR